MKIRLIHSLLLVTMTLVSGCGSKKKPPLTQAGVSQSGATVTESSGRQGHSTRQRIIRMAEQEWDFFGRQTVRLDGADESMPHVGKWEDDGDPWSTRVNWYWSAAGKPGLDGFDCKEPWSAAFITWVMRQAGLSSSDFPSADAHWEYIHYFIDRSGQAGAAFASHGIAEYPPKPGDLICATRGNNGFIPVYSDNPSAVLAGHTKLHCDIVTEKTGNTLASIGGNVRNSVSKTYLQLTPDGLLHPSERRPWFVVLENRLNH